MSFKNSFSFRDVDAVHETMEDLQEQHDIANEISEAISTPAGFGADVDMVRSILFFYVSVVLFSISFRICRGIKKLMTMLLKYARHALHNLYNIKHI